jgi:hypothetical protein
VDEVIDEEADEERVALLVTVLELALLVVVSSPFWNGRAMTTPRSIVFVAASAQQLPSL